MEEGSEMKPLYAREKEIYQHYHRDDEYYDYGDDVHKGIHAISIPE